MKVIPMSPNMTSGLNFEELTTFNYYYIFFQETNRCLSLRYFYMGRKNYDAWWDTKLNVLLSGQDTEETTLLTIGDYSTPLNEWTTAKATVPATRGLKVGI